MNDFSIEGIAVSGISDLIELLRPLLIRLNSRKLNQITFPENSVGKTYLIQYWSQNEPPEEVSKAFKLWDNYLARSRCIEVARFNKKTALSWLNENSPELSTVFKKAIHPAMEADIFRLAFAYKHGCIWIDADHVPPKLPSKRHYTLSSLDAWSLGKSSSFLMKHWREKKPYLNNSIFLARENCPLVSALVHRILNFEPSEFQSSSGVSEFAGPKAFTEEADKLISLAPVTININTYGQVVILNSEMQVIFRVSNLFRFLGARKEYVDVLGGSDTWQYKSDASLNWKLL